MVIGHGKESVGIICRQSDDSSIDVWFFLTCKPKCNQSILREIYKAGSRTIML